MVRFSLSPVIGSALFNPARRELRQGRIAVQAEKRA